MNITLLVVQFCTTKPHIHKDSMGGIIITLEHYDTENIYLFDSYHFGEIPGESITQNHSLESPLGIFITCQDSLRDIICSTQCQES